MKQIVCILFCMLFSLTVFAQEKTDGPSGKWEFNAPEVPYGYDKGNVEFKTTNGKLNVILNVNYSNITIDQVEMDGDTYKCSLNIEGSNVEVSFKQQDGTLVADLKVDGSPVGVTLKKLD